MQNTYLVAPMATTIHHIAPFSFQATGHILFFFHHMSTVEWYPSMEIIHMET